MYKYANIIYAYGLRFELLSDALISDRHTTSGIHKNQRSNQVCPRTDDSCGTKAYYETDKQHL